MNLIWNSLCFTQSGKVTHKKKMRGGVGTEKNFKLEKDINRNYIHMPYLEKKNPETIPSVEMKAFVDCIFYLSSN